MNRFIENLGAERTGAKPGSGIMRGFVFFSIIYYLFNEIFAGPIRYYLSSKAVALIYLPKLLITAVVLAAVVGFIWNNRISKVVVYVGILFICSCVVGLVNTRLPQVVLGISSYFPLIFGLFGARYIEENKASLTKLFLLFWLFAVAGVIISHNVSFPWKGGEYSIGDYDVESSREWSAFGVDRPAGFSRASYAVAYQIVILSVWLLIFMRSVFFRLGIFTISIIAIYVTTAKTAVIVYFLAVMLVVSLSDAIPSKYYAYIKRVSLWLVVLLGIGLPFSTLFYKYSFSFRDQNMEFLLTSFGIRLSETWPNAFNLIINGGNWFWGRGIGGMGMAQKVFEIDSYNPGDNFFVKLYSEFGLLFIPVVIVVVQKASRLNVINSPWNKFIFVVIFCYLTKGMTSNCIEDAFSSLFMGAAIFCIFRSLKKS